MRILTTLLVCLLTGTAFSETCTLETYASSWMATGTPFSVKCPSGVYAGHLVTTPAKRFFRRGHMFLVFDQPVALVSKNPADEGKLEANRGRQIANILLDGGAGIGTKDLTDGLSGAVFKSWEMIPISCITLAFFSNGGDILLKPGYQLQVTSRRDAILPKATTSAGN
ncbi:MAG: hypothetical protein ABR928_20710 [Terracidiphilus sp.]